jgi:hypothetical protein
MCLAENGDILLCLQAKGADGKIVRLSPNGNVISEHSKNLKGEILFRNPDRVLQNISLKTKSTEILIFSLPFLETCFRICGR